MFKDHQAQLPYFTDEETEVHRWERTCPSHLGSGKGITELEVEAGRTLRPSKFSGGASDKESTCQCRRHERPGFDPWTGKILWRRKWAPTPLFLPGELHGQRSLAGGSPWCGRVWAGTYLTPACICFIFRDSKDFCGGWGCPVPSFPFAAGGN